MRHDELTISPSVDLQMLHLTTDYELYRLEFVLQLARMLDPKLNPGLSGRNIGLNAV